VKLELVPIERVPDKFKIGDVLKVLEGSPFWRGFSVTIDNEEEYFGKLWYRGVFFDEDNILHHWWFPAYLLFKEGM
jgi:hypothetical protein